MRKLTVNLSGLGKLFTTRDNLSSWPVFYSLSGLYFVVRSCAGGGSGGSGDGGSGGGGGGGEGVGGDGGGGGSGGVGGNRPCIVGN